MPKTFTIRLDHADLYALEKFDDAVRALDGAGDNLRAGLFDAALCILRVRPDEMPDAELYRAHAELRRDLTSAGKLEDTLRGMSDYDAAALAARVRTLHGRLLGRLG